MANKWATACPFVVLANLNWENNMTESSVIYFPLRIGAKWRRLQNKQTPSDNWQFCH